MKYLYVKLGVWRLAFGVWRLAFGEGEGEEEGEGTSNGVWQSR